ncbi:MAG: hypothetical protein HS111_06420 [Kofleriaceae bacterium]|nr:hypothetical protein [Kofleriaceae bacterium]
MRLGGGQGAGAGWDVGRAPDQQHPDDLQVGWTLQLYGFAPRHPHGHPACAERFE